MASEDEATPGHVVAVSAPEVAVARRMVALAFAPGIDWRAAADRAVGAVVAADEPTDAMVAAAELLEACAAFSEAVRAIRRPAHPG
jgi:hypothetical protein